MSDGLSHDEVIVLEAAQAGGWLLASGQRIAVLVAFKRWCARTGRSCILARRGARAGLVEVEGRVRWRGPVDALEQAAARIAQEAARYLGGSMIGGRMG